MYRAGELQDGGDALRVDGHDAVDRFTTRLRVQPGDDAGHGREVGRHVDVLPGVRDLEAPGAADEIVGGAQDAFVAGFAVQLGDPTEPAEAELAVVGDDLPVVA